MICLVKKKKCRTLSCRAGCPSCSKVHGCEPVINNCIRCAERNLIRDLVRKSYKSGVKSHQFSAWLHRKHGSLVIWRERGDGVLGNSLPCVICRKMIEKYNIQWTAYTGKEWVKSNSYEPVPDSKPTNKQRRYMNFTNGIKKGGTIIIK